MWIYKSPPIYLQELFLMRKWVLSIAVTTSLLGLTACNSGGDDSEAVVTTKAGDITKDELYNEMKEKYGDQVLQELVYEKVLSEKYKVTDKELDAKVAELKEQMGDNFATALAQSGYEDEDALKSSMRIGMLQEKAAIKDIKVKESEIKKRYEETQPQIKARHILVADEKTAKDVKAKLAKGEKFEDLAKEVSTDTGSKEAGGDLGWFGTGAMLPEFEEAAYKLKKGEISEPVKTEYGYHIIQLQDKKEKESYDKLKGEIEYDLKVEKIKADKVQSILDKELEDAKVKIKDKDLEDALTPAKAPAAQ